MEKGEEINEDLKKAIVSSRICMPIFSKNYASSKACLGELSHMVQCKSKIIPIFYDATPDDVKLKTQLYKKHLEEYGHNSKIGLDKVEKWEKALSKVAEISGYELLDKSEADEIASITQDLLDMMPKRQDVTNMFVEVDEKEELVKLLLNLSPHEWHIIGIHGLGGIGKTTLAKVIFNQFSLSFDRCSFLENVREKLQNGRHLELQQQVYKDIIDSKMADRITDRNDGINKIQYGLKNKKVLLVFDDINDEEQLKELLGHGHCFARGSRIIITTRGKEILDSINLKYKRVLYHKVEAMKNHQALKLFCRTAFNEDSPPVDYECVSKTAVSYTRGLPLALKVIGSLLCHTKKVDWEKTLDELRTCQDDKIKRTMMISYEALNDDQKDLFLDIANVPGHMPKDYACYMWEDCGLNPNRSIPVLVNRSLIDVIYVEDCWGSKFECLQMHDLLIDFGRDIVRATSRRDHTLPSRLHIHGMLDNRHGIKEKGHVETLIIENRNITITREDMVGFENLRFLTLKVSKVKGDFKGLFPKLRWFVCIAEEFKPINFNPENLVILEIASHKPLKWKGTRRMKVDKLKILNLSTFRPGITSSWFFNSVNRNWILNARNLEELSLDIGYKVAGLEEMGKLIRIKDLSLDYVKFKYVPKFPSRLLRLCLNICEFVDGILEVSNLGKLISFCVVEPKKLKEIKGLQKLYSLEKLCLKGLNKRNMEELEVIGSRSLKEVPDADISCLETPSSSNSCPIERIISSNRFVSLTSLSLALCSSIEIIDLSTLRKLRSLKLSSCHELRYIQGIPQLESLDYVKIRRCSSLELSHTDFINL